MIASAPRDASLTRGRILAAARCSFARHGYDGTTVRGVAADAGVAPNLITRYFGGKEGLFRAATAGHLNVQAVLPGPPGELGSRIAANVVRRWDLADGADPLLMMLRSAGNSEETARALGEFFDREGARPLAAHLEAELGYTAAEAEASAVAVGALIMGVVTMRHVTRTGPLAAAGSAAAEAWLGAQLQRLIDRPAGPSPASPRHRRS